MGLPNWRRWPALAGRVMPRSFGEAQHLGADTDAAFIQRFDRDFVALATLSKQVPLPESGNPQKSARRCWTREYLACPPCGRPVKPGVALFDEKGCDAAIAGRRIHGGEDDEQSSLAGIGDP